MRLGLIFIFSSLTLFRLPAVGKPLKSCELPFFLPVSTSLPVFDLDLFQIYENEIKELKSLQKAALSAALQAKNQAAIAEFYNKNKSVEALTSQTDRPKKNQTKQILQSLINHPVIGEKAAQKYDPANEIGFCFGRAAYVHFQLLRLGVNPQHIAKVFVMGGLFRAGVGWEYHVATIVQDKSGTWLVIDSLVDEVLTLENWMRTVSQWDSNRLFPKLRFYFMDASKFQPTRGSYEATRLYSPIYRGYFKDLLLWFAAENCLKPETSK